MMTTVRYCLIVVLLALVVPTVPAAEERSDFETFGDILSVGIPLAGLGTTVVLRDWDGSLQFAYSMATAGAITGTLKTTVDKTRPNTGHNSFPSGHSTGAFGGAAFIQRRYGWWAGTPAYGLAAVCAYSRIDAKKHDIFDVSFGALSGIVGVYIWTEPYQVGETTVTLLPWGGEDYYGLQFVAWKDREQELSHREARLADRLKPSGAAGPSFSLKGDSSGGNGLDPTQAQTALKAAFFVMDQSREPDPTERYTTGYVGMIGGDWSFRKHHQLSLQAKVIKNNGSREDPYDSFGMGDTIAGYLWRFFERRDDAWWKATGLALGVELSMPTGDWDDGLSSDSWIVKPKITGAWTFFDNIRFYPELAWYTSFSENHGHGEVSMIGIKTGVQYQFPDAFYVAWTPELFIDENHSDSANHEMEVGYPMKNGWVPYFRYTLVGNSNWTYNPLTLNRPRYYDDVYGLGVRKLF